MRTELIKQAIDLQFLANQKDVRYCEESKKNLYKTIDIYNSLTDEEKEEFKNIRWARIMKNNPTPKSEILTLDEEDLKNYW